MVGLYPWVESYFNFTDGSSVPFSASLILNICHRIINRESHETVSGEDTKKLFLALSFVLLYKNVNYIEKVKANDCKYHSWHTLNFGVGVSPYAVKNGESIEIPNRWLVILERTLKGIVAFRDGEQNCNELAQMLRTDCSDLSPFIGFVPDTQIYSEVSGLIESIF